MVTRRAVLLAGAAGLLPAAGCAAPTPAPVRPEETSVAGRLAELERRFSARLGVYARDTGRGTVVAYHADQRFPMCSTFKVLAAAAVLHRYRPAELGQRVRYRRADLEPPSPVTAAHLGAAHLSTGLTLRQLGQAAVSDSDSTAANLLLAKLGGPAGVTRYARSLGDRVTRLDRTEPTLNQGLPGDDRDTTSPRAIAGDYAALVLGSALPRADRSLLTRWLTGSTTGAGRIRAAVPPGWTVGDKTGRVDVHWLRSVGQRRCSALGMAVWFRVFPAPVTCGYEQGVANQAAERAGPDRRATGRGPAPADP